ncbi:MAG TPA: universal stress protein [Candidatus Obscuribacter sp.]|nr:universal stress protein [Candidatus Obscuribacter sp.]
MKILLAIDVAQSTNKDEAKAAQELVNIKSLAKLLPLDKSQVTLLYVKEELPSFEQVLKAQADFPEDLTHVVERRAGKILDILKKGVEQEGASVNSEIVSGPPAQLIETVARDLGADVVVLAQSKHHDSIFLSRVSHHVARHSPVSTILLREGADEDSLDKTGAKTVVIGLDGSKNCKESVIKALKLLNLDKEKTNLILTYVVNVSKIIASVTPFSFVTAMQENLMMEGEVFLADTQKELSSLGYKKLSIHLKAGRPDAEILKLLDEKGGNLVVIGAQGGGAIKHFLMGHICERVISQAPVSTLVARG